MIKTKIPAKKVVSLYAYQHTKIKFSTDETSLGDPTTTCTSAMTTTHIFIR